MLKLKLLTLSFILSQVLVAQRFVDVDATGANDGSSWVNAFSSLNEAVDRSPAGSSLWIAEGTYRLSKTLNLNEADLDLYGGFAGDETNLSQRTGQLSTIVTADVNGDDLTGDLYANSSDNLEHVLFIITSTPMTIDGLIFEGGRARTDGVLGQQNASGAGIYCNGEITFKNVIVRRNLASRGAGIYLTHSLAISGVYKLEDCLIEGNESTVGSAGVYAGFGGTTADFRNVTFRNNKSREGAAILVAGAALIANVYFDACTFDGNQADYGGAVETEGFGRPIFNNCTFINNSGARGGAVNINDFSTAEFIGCFWENNSASPTEEDPGVGGALYLDDGSSAYLRDNIFENNSGVDAGGAIFFVDDIGEEITLEITGGSFSENQSEFGWGGAIYAQGVSKMLIEDVTFSNGLASRGGAIMTNGFVDVDIRDSKFIDNMADAGGAFFTNEIDDNIRIEDSEFIRNFAYDGGGAFFSLYGAKTRMFNNIFQNNETFGFGGAIYSLGDFSPELMNITRCIFDANYSSVVAGAIYHGDGDMFINTCLFYDNLASGDGIGNSISSNEFDDIESKLVLLNTTFHEDASGLGAIAQYSSVGTANVIESRNTIFSGGGVNWALEEGEVQFISLGGNLSDDESMKDILNEESDINNSSPGFVDSDNNDFRLEVGSPCIDAGILEGAPAGDITGMARVGNPDIGAYELEMECDADGGDVYLASGGDMIELCAGQVKFSARHNTDSRLPYYYVITNEDDIILAYHKSSESQTLDLSAAPAGECHIWGFSYDRARLPSTGVHVESLLGENCSDISDDYIRVLRLTEEECNEPCHTPRNLRVKPVKGGANISWTRVPEARYYNLKVSFPDGGESIVYRVSSRSVKITSSEPIFSVSVAVVCKYNNVSDYSAEVEVDNSSDKSSSKSSTGLNKVGITEINELASVQSFPNPVMDFLNIEFDASGVFAKAQIVDVMGRIQVAQQIDEDAQIVKLDMSRLNSGLYTLFLIGENDVMHREVITKMSE